MLAAPALAQADAQSARRPDWRLPFSLTMVSMTGKISTLPIDKAMADNIMKEAKPLATGVVLLTVDGKTYVASDMKMADSKSMVDWFQKLGAYRQED